jgi:hypothetical protein
MSRRTFLKSALGGIALGADAAPQALSRAKTLTPKYRAGVIGLGWTGLLYDLAKRVPDRFNVDDVNRPTPELNIHRKFYYHDHPGNEGLPDAYSEALWGRPEVQLVAGAERDPKRLKAFGERYGIRALYTDALEMLAKEKLDIVAICTNIKGRAFLTVKAAEYGARGIFTEKPMCHMLAEADQMVRICAERKIPLCCGAITTTHPSFAKAKQLVTSGALSEILSMEAPATLAQHQNWSYFLDSAPAWVAGTGDSPRRESGSDEFTGEGILVAKNGQVVHFRRGAPGVRISGAKGQMCFDFETGWQLWQDVETAASKGRVACPGRNLSSSRPTGWCTASQTSSTVWKAGSMNRRIPADGSQSRWRSRSRSNCPRSGAVRESSCRCRTVPLD